MTNVSRFKIGDRVINKYNQHGTVTGHADGFVRVRVRVDGLQYDGGWYESSLRFETPVPTPTPVNPESKFGFTVGQRVRITTNVPGYISKFGNEGIVTGFENTYSKDFIRVLTDKGNSGAWYPSSLTLIAPVAPTAAPAPTKTESQLGFTIGQRVEILNKGYTGGQYGVVTGFMPTLGMYGTPNSIAFVEVTTDKGAKGGWLPSSIELVAPAVPALTPNQVETLPVPQSKSQAARLSVQTGTQLKYAGQNAAVSKNSEVYRIAKDIAVELGRNWKQVNIDMVQGVLVSRGYKAADLGNAAGAIFRGKNWKDTGTTHLSRRESNHARRITVWAYVGA